MKTLFVIILMASLCAVSVSAQNKSLDLWLEKQDMNETQRKSLLPALSSLIEMQRKREWEKIYRDFPAELFADKSKYEDKSKEQILRFRLSLKTDELENNFLDFTPVSILPFYTKPGDKVRIWTLYGCGKWKDGSTPHRQYASVRVYWKDDKWYIREVNPQTPPDYLDCMSSK